MSISDVLFNLRDLYLIRVSLFHVWIDHWTANRMNDCRRLTCMTYGVSISWPAVRDLPLLTVKLQCYVDSDVNKRG